MIAQSVDRLFHPRVIDFGISLPVAGVGLLVNVLSVWLLHAHAHEDDEHDHGHAHHDHNHRAALLHVVADTLTSALAIVALLAALLYGWVWMDAATGIVGALVILRWGIGLCRSAAFELLDVDPSAALEQEIRAALEAIDDVMVSDLHVWSLGHGARSCIATVVSASPREVGEYRARLARFRLSHLTIEVRRARRTATTRTTTDP
jgi:cation diffusion facilitator family transporter